MNKFMQDYQLFITPLSPIHLGTGEDFLPTNYVIDGGLLYEFDPAKAVLNTKEINDLKNASNSTDIKTVYQFFKNNPKPFRACAYRKVGVSEKVAHDYQTKLGQNVQKNNPHGNKKESVINDLSIACTSTNPQTHLPVVFGSALKGCVRTAVLNDLCKEKYTDDKTMQNKLLGSFSEDMFSAFKPSDLTAISKNIDTYASYAYQYKKHGENKNGTLPIRIETIAPAQFQAFSGSLNIYSEKNINKKLPDIKEIIKMLNNYHIAIWNKENKLLKQQNIANDEWREKTTQLLKSLENQFNNGEMALIRLGKLCGAESKTLPNVAKIKIMRGKGNTPDYRSENTTIWLTEDKLPLGWALLEVNPSGENAALKTWCESNKQIVEKINQTIEKAEKEDKELKEKLAKQQEEEQKRKEQEATEKAEKERQKQAAALAEKQRRASLSDVERRKEDFEREMKNVEEKLETKLKLINARQPAEIEKIYNEFKQFLENAIRQYSADECKEIAEKFNRKKLAKKYPTMVANNRINELKALLTKLHGE